MLGFYLLEMQKNNTAQWLSRKKLLGVQSQKLKEVIDCAYQSAYYKDLLLHAKLLPSDISFVDDLSRIPITTKSMIENLSFKKRICGKFDQKKDSIVKTSGSYAMPSIVVLSEHERMKRWLSVLRMYRAHGVKYTDKIMYIFNPAFIGPRKYPWLERLGILPAVSASVFSSPEKNLEVFLQSSPDVLRGYASAIGALAQLVKKEKISVSQKLKKVFSTADELSQATRALIEQTFKTEVVDHYATQECGLIAWECKEHHGLHINEDRVIVELIKSTGDKAKKGEFGRIVVTSLESKKMPFIRYDTGDYGMFLERECVCGRSFKILHKIAGRSNDKIKFSNGREGLVFPLLKKMNNIKDIVSYQIAQISKGMHKVYVVCQRVDLKQISDGVQSVYYELFEEQIKVKIMRINKIDHEHNGKRKAFKDLIRKTKE